MPDRLQSEQEHPKGPAITSHRKHNIKRKKLIATEAYYTIPLCDITEPGRLWTDT